MATARPCVGVYSLEGKVCGSALMPSVFQAPLRPDLVRFVSVNLEKNKRQAYGVAPNAGYQTSAESWGTGRAVARIPRVPGGGTHRSGQAAFGNMCRGGGMFAPNKTWRRWHRKVNVTMKRHAAAAAIAATGLPALVMAKGHRVEDVPELPLVVQDEAEALTKTKEAAKLLQLFGLSSELQKVKDSKKLRAGRGKGRNRRFTLRKGPLVVYAKDDGITRAFRNLPGVDLCQVDRLSVLSLAPGGTMGRLCLYTAGAFKRLQLLFGRADGVGTAALKKDYHLPRPLLQNADLARLINSDEIQTAVRPALKGPVKRRQHKNLLTNRSVLLRVNPAAKTTKKNARLAQEAPGSKPHVVIQKKKQQKRLERKQHRKNGKLHMKSIRQAFADKAAENMAAAAAAKDETAFVLLSAAVSLSACILVWLSVCICLSVRLRRSVSLNNSLTLLLLLLRLLLMVMLEADEELSPSILAARAKLRERFASAQQIGGKGTARLRGRKQHKSAVGDDKKLQLTLKRLGAASVFGVDEVYLLRADGSALFFQSPKVQAAPACNTYVLAGAPEERANVGPLLGMKGLLGAAGGADGAAINPALLKQLQEHMESLSRKDLQKLKGAAATNEEDNADDVPDLVADFEEASKQ
ncbi:hypothetical protein Efla_000571 [Eimeria flavescens]